MEAGRFPAREKRPTAAERRNFFDPEHPLAEEEYLRLYEERLAKDTAFDPKLKRVIELRSQYRETGKPFEGLDRRLQEWILEDGDEAAQTRREMLRHATTLTDLLAITYQWKEDELRELFDPAEPHTRRTFAKRLIEQDIDPSPFLRDAESAAAAIDEVHNRLYQKLEAVDVPRELFNQTTYDQMIHAGLERNLKALSYRLATPETQKFADAAYQMRVGGKLLRPVDR